MHAKYGKGEFRAISLNLDDPEDEEFRQEAIKFLKGVKARFENYLLDEKSETWQKHFGVTILPCVLVYGKDGKLAKKFDSEGKNMVSYAEVEKLVKKLLEKQD